MSDGEPFLVCRVLNRLCALPLRHIEETMRPLSVEPLAGFPRLIRGVAIIRGAPAPVVDLAWILSAEESQPTRFVTVRVDGRRIAIAVDSVVGVRTISDSMRDLPPLCADGSNEAIATIGTLDAQLLVVLRDGRLVPEGVWNALEANGVSP